MMIIHNLAQLSWQLSGWRPEHWRLSKSMELGWKLDPDISPIPARVPGSVQQALRDSDLLPDWNTGLQSRQCEWVENRHWMFETVLPSEWTDAAGRKILHCQGLDYRGVVWVNGQEVGQFCGTMTPHRFDLTDYLGAGDNKLIIAFNGVPDYLGQICWTSRINEWKPRFNYCWDWTPRIVQIGIWDDIHLEVDQGDAIDALAVFTDYDRKSRRASVMLDAQLMLSNATQVEILVQTTAVPATIITREVLPATSQLRRQINLGPVEAWHPNGNGSQTLYQICVKLLDATGTVLASQSRRLGFREIQWKPCAGAPAAALPWICCINGVDTFLQGFNWVPLRPNFADVTVADYRHRLETYQAMGTNVLRVWGGAFLEKECFYDLCDELGILVWQEFPLSSSGIDNWPPEYPPVIAEMKAIATTYIQRRKHHASLLLWCGGNELQGGPDGSKIGTGKPVDVSHPMMKMLSELLTEMDPTRRFLPTSSSGPRFMAAQEDFGKGWHHDVHGPWNHSGDLSGWFDYWKHDDALFRSETGMPSASSTEIIRQFGQTMEWPANKTNPYWNHSSAWWIQWDDYLAAGGDSQSLEAFVTWSQKRQAEALAYAARMCKSRFPACGGIIVWMGHDTYPCPANTAVIDFHGKRKPAADALASIFLSRTPIPPP